MTGLNHDREKSPTAPSPSAPSPLADLKETWLDRLRRETEALAEARYAQSLAGEMAHGLDPSSPEVGMLTQFRNALRTVGKRGSIADRAQMQRGFGNLRFFAREKISQVDQVALEMADPRTRERHDGASEALALMLAGQLRIEQERERTRQLYRTVTVLGALDDDEPGYFTSLGIRAMDWTKNTWGKLKTNLKEFTRDMDGLRRGAPSDATGADKLRLWKEVLKIQEIESRMPENPTPEQIKAIVDELQQPLEVVSADLGDLAQERERKVEMQASLVEGVRSDAREQMLARHPELRSTVATMVMARDTQGLQSLDAAPATFGAEPPEPAATPAPSPGVSLRRRPQDRTLEAPAPTFRF